MEIDDVNGQSRQVKQQPDAGLKIAQILSAGPISSLVFTNAAANSQQMEPLPFWSPSGVTNENSESKIIKIHFKTIFLYVYKEYF